MPYGAGVCAWDADDGDGDGDGDDADDGGGAADGRVMGEWRWS